MTDSRKIPVLTNDAAGQFLGYSAPSLSVSRKTGWLGSRPAPKHLVINGRYFYALSELEAWKDSEKDGTIYLDPADIEKMQVTNP